MNNNTKPKYVAFEFRQLDKINNLPDETYLDLKYLGLCSILDRLSKLIYQNEKSGFKRFKDTIDKYYTGDDFKLIDLRFFNEVQFLIGKKPNNPYLENNAKPYYKLLFKESLYSDIKKIFDKERILTSIDNDSPERYKKIDDLMQILEKNKYKDLDEAESYFQLFDNIHILYYLLRCPLTHENESLFLIRYGYDLFDCTDKLSTSSKLTPELISLIIKTILERLEFQLLENVRDQI